MRPAVKARHRRNLQLARRKEFVAGINLQITDQMIDVVRIHAVGDFFDVKYVRKWQQIVRKNRRTKFYAYSRSWTNKHLRKALVELAREPNFTLFWSTDNSMPRPPRYKHIRVAWLAMNDYDLPPYPVDLVFRHNARTPVKRMGGYQVCPYEQKIPRQVAMTCSRCRLCFDCKTKSQWMAPRESAAVFCV